MANETEPHGPNGFPLCKNCGAERRSERVQYPGFCAECVDLGRAGEPVDAAPAPSDAGEGDTQPND